MGLIKAYLIPAGIVLGIVIAFFAVTHLPRVLTIDPNSTSTQALAQNTSKYPPLNKAAYDAKLLKLANLKITISSSTATSTTSTPSLWPAKTVYPGGGAVLPFDRIVAYYGNFYSKQMGILGEYPESQVLEMLQATVTQWQNADPSTPVIPAIDYIAVTAQDHPGPDGKYMLRMPQSQIDKAIEMAKQVNGLVFLDVQVGQSNVETEVPLLEQYLKLPQVELALDPEFDMWGGHVPGTVIGRMDASDINFAANYLANIVKENNLPPKILVIHRFTQTMVINYKEIQPLPQVEIVMDMDGFGPSTMKITTYKDFIASEPVQFTGFKLFFKNDIKQPGSHLMTPEEILKLSPQPSFIQYQ
ncbi:MAG: hypothetical protein KGJ01_00010 [Patescibacteria group bacterium]|nr:hypothetical protein [Patescibacteria group bacterium]